MASLLRRQYLDENEENSSRSALDTSSSVDRPPNRLGTAPLLDDVTQKGYQFIASVESRNTALEHVLLKKEVEYNDLLGLYQDLRARFQTNYEIASEQQQTIDAMNEELEKNRSSNVEYEKRVDDLERQLCSCSESLRCAQLDAEGRRSEFERDCKLLRERLAEGERRHGSELQAQQAAFTVRFEELTVSCNARVDEMNATHSRQSSELHSEIQRRAAESSQRELEMERRISEMEKAFHREKFTVKSREDELVVVRKSLDEALVALSTLRVSSQEQDTAHGDQLHAKERRIYELGKELQDLTQSHDALQRDGERRKHETSQAKARCDALTKQLSEQSHRIDALKKETSDTAAKSQGGVLEAIREKDEEKRRHEEVVQGINFELQASRESAAKWEREASRLQLVEATAREQAAHLERACQGLDRRLKSTEKERDELSEQLLDLRNRFEATERKEKEAAHRSLQRERELSASFEEQRKDLDKQLALSRKETSEARRQLYESENARKVLENTLLSVQHSDAEVKLRMSIERTAILEDRIRQLQDEAVARQQGMDRLIQDIQNDPVAAELSTAKNKIAEVTAQLTSAEKEKIRQQLHLEQLQATAELRAEQATRDADDLRRLKEDNQRLRLALDSERRRVDKMIAEEGVASRLGPNTLRSDVLAEEVEELRSALDMKTAELRREQHERGKVNARLTHATSLIEVLNAEKTQLMDLTSRLRAESLTWIQRDQAKKDGMRPPARPPVEDIGKVPAAVPATLIESQSDDLTAHRLLLKRTVDQLKHPAARTSMTARGTTTVTGPVTRPLNYAIAEPRR